MGKDHSNKDYFWVPIYQDVAEYLIKNYSQDWEGMSPNGIDLDSWIGTLKESNRKHIQTHFPNYFPSAPIKEEEEF